MIVAETNVGYRFVTQSDHAALVGRFADHWGNDTFEEPEPAARVAMAAHCHDDGWIDRDRRPYLAEDGSPENFLEIDPEPWVTLYDDGIDDVIALDSYAGLLVSMHGAGLRRQRYGLSPNWPRTPAAFVDFVDRQEARQRALVADLLDESETILTEKDRVLLEELHEFGKPRDECDSRLWQNYKLLQAWDTLSLSFCETTSPPSYGQIDSVPTSGEPNRDAAITIESMGEGTYAVDPYPFETELLEASIPIRTVRRKALENEDDLVRTFYASSRETIQITLVRPDS